MKKIFPLLLLLISFQKILAQTKSVLFIGNSYTSVNSLPSTVHLLALSKGDTLFTDSNTPGGYTFMQHTTNTTTLAKIAQQQWNYVVLQEQSQMPAFPQSQVQIEVYPYSTILDSLIHANDSCSETVFYMTWGRKNGDASNCASYPPICTYEGMQQGLRESYLAMGQMNNASVAPVGMAWKKIIADSLSFDLYQSDESHPSVYGTYLTACVFYSIIYQKSPVGASYIGGVTDTSIALLLQQTAEFIVFDSIALWMESGNIPFAGFDFSTTGTTVTFQSTDLNGSQFQWDLGDGSSSALQNPSHNYTPGTYTVTQIVINNCLEDTATQQVVILPSGIDNANEINQQLFFSEGNLFVKTETAATLFIYDSLGKISFSRYLNGNKNLGAIPLNFPSGFYIAILQSENKGGMKTKLIIP